MVWRRPATEPNLVVARTLRAAGARTRQPENSKRAHFRAPALQTPPKFYEKTPRETQKERNDGGKGKKEREILGPPPLGAPPFGAPPWGAPPLGGPTLGGPTLGAHPSGPTLRGPTFSRFGPPTLGGATLQTTRETPGRPPGDLRERRRRGNKVKVKGGGRD